MWHIERYTCVILKGLYVERAFAQALEKTTSNMNWMDINVHIIVNWLKEAGY